MRLHPRFDIDQMLHHIEKDRITIEMAVAPIALAIASHPTLESLRLVVTALHHVGRDAGQRQRRRDGDPAHRRRLGSGLRHHELPVIACNPLDGAPARHGRAAGARGGPAGGVAGDR